MEIHYRRELDVSYLIIEEGLPSEMISARMVGKASPAGLLHMECRETENGVEYRYAIDGLKSLEGSLGTREIRAAEIRSLMHSLYRVSNELQEYLLQPDRLFLEPGLIYRGRDEWHFCYDPSRSEDFFAQLQALSRYLLRKSDRHFLTALMTNGTILHIGLCLIIFVTIFPIFRKIRCRSLSRLLTNTRRIT